ncbi:MAG: ABC transporter permease, partial [Armatimonadota bacterium]
SVVVGTALTAIAVGTVGIIGFLGLVAPHLARLRFGADVRRMLLPSALFGAILLVLADIIAGRGSPTGELPVGVVTALLGAPSLLILLRRTLKSP